jgi:hypothetical protein
MNWISLQLVLACDRHESRRKLFRRSGGAIAEGPAPPRVIALVPDQRKWLNLPTHAIEKFERLLILFHREPEDQVRGLRHEITHSRSKPIA